MEAELFHAVNDADSAAARRRVLELGLKERIEFRNVFFAEVAAELRARGGGRVPALWRKGRLVEGLEPVLAALATL